MSHLTLTLDGALAFNLNNLFDATQINVTADQIGTGTYTVNITDSGMIEGTYTLMTVAGNYEATNFILGTSNSNYSLNWNEGTLSLNVIPEPGASILLLLGGTTLLGRVSRKDR